MLPSTAALPTPTPVNSQGEASAADRSQQIGQGVALRQSGD
ncbi:MAG: hypothetical protein ACUVRV_07425 [Cyanobacteriota bacterium]